MKKIGLLYCLFFLSSFHVTPSYAQNELYYLCGPDEDGCPAGFEEYCTCTPLNNHQRTKPYCLDFDNMTCEPLSAVSDCSAQHTFKDQGSCLATIFQSEPTPPCKMVTKLFCEDHHVAMCDAKGNPESCQK